jgi:hypothetical protein
MTPDHKHIADRDWPEDFAMENGNYMCRCRLCKETFAGHKRRLACKSCDQPNAKAAPEPVQGEAVDDDQMLSAESKKLLYEINRMVYRPDETVRDPEQHDSVFAWAYTRDGERHLTYPSKVYDQIRLGLCFGEHDAGPRRDYTDWAPLMTVAQHRRLMAAAKPDTDLVERVAKVIYEQWSGNPHYSPWVDGGNSFKQDDCRALAHKALRIDAKLAELRK